MEDVKNMNMKDATAAIEAAAAAATGATAEEKQDDLEKMKLEELKAAAASLGLDVTGAKKKADLIKLIEEAQQPDSKNEEAQGEAQEEDQPAIQEAKGRVLVMYNGMVNLRTIDGEVDGKAMQGQTFPVKGKLERDGVTWYWIADRDGRDHLISGQVVRYMQ